MPHLDVGGSVLLVRVVHVQPDVEEPPDVGHGLLGQRLVLHTQPLLLGLDAVQHPRGVTYGLLSRWYPCQRSLEAGECCLGLQGCLRCRHDERGHGRQGGDHALGDRDGVQCSREGSDAYGQGARGCDLGLRQHERVILCPQDFELRDAVLDGLQVCCSELECLRGVQLAPVGLPCCLEDHVDVREGTEGAGYLCC